MSDILRLEEISKSFSNVHAVEKLSLAMPAGCIYGFLGPNGAGKTTTIRMIMDIIRPDSGKISILGESSFHKIRDRIGYLPEERGLYRKMKVRNILTYIGSIKSMKREAITRTVTPWLKEMDLSEWADKKVVNLSKGMQQKLQFIAAIINDPELVILDEPFSGLDPINLEIIKDIMMKMRDEGKTVIFSTHMMEHAEKLCDYILLINRGKKVFDGTLEQVRSPYAADNVAVELEGDIQFVSNIPFVRTVEQEGRRINVTLNEGTDHQELLRILTTQSRVRSFEVKAPSLHEIFIRQVDTHDR